MSTQKLSFFSSSQLERWKKIRGWLLPESAEYLYNYCREGIKLGNAVEIGSYAGKSATCLGKALIDSSTSRQLTCIDLRFQPDLRMNLKAFDLGSHVTLVEAPSLDIADSWEEPIGFLYIDGHHGKTYALADLIAWDAYVVSGGIVALDDTAGFMIGPNLQVIAAIESGAYRFLAEAGGITFLKKIKNILPHGEFPVSTGSFLAHLQVVSSWVGAFDLHLREPKIIPQSYPLSFLVSRLMDTPPKRMIESAKRFFAKRTRKKTAQSQNPTSFKVPQEAIYSWKIIRSFAEGRKDDQPLMLTIDYLNAAIALKANDISAATSLFERVSLADPTLFFPHYELSFRAMATLRLGQCLDLLGDRRGAISNYEKIKALTQTEEIRNFASALCSQKFTRNDGQAILLREYNLPLSRYKRH